MDFLKGVGNWFRGVFGGSSDDDERKRRRQQEAQKPTPRPQPQQQQIQLPNQQQTNQNPFQQNNNRGANTLNQLFHQNQSNQPNVPERFQFNSSKDKELIDKIPGYRVMSPEAQQRALAKQRQREVFKQAANRTSNLEKKLEENPYYAKARGKELKKNFTKDEIKTVQEKTGKKRRDQISKHNVFDILRQEANKAKIDNKTQFKMGRDIGNTLYDLQGSKGLSETTFGEMISNYNNLRGNKQADIRENLQRLSLRYEKENNNVAKNYVDTISTILSKDYGLVNEKPTSFMRKAGKDVKTAGLLGSGMEALADVFSDKRKESDPRRLRDIERSNMGAPGVVQDIASGILTAPLDLTVGTLRRSWTANQKEDAAKAAEWVKAYENEQMSLKELRNAIASLPSNRGTDGGFKYDEKTGKIRDRNVLESTAKFAGSFTEAGTAVAPFGYGTAARGVGAAAKGSAQALRGANAAQRLNPAQAILAADAASASAQLGSLPLQGRDIAPEDVALAVGGTLFGNVAGMRPGRKATNARLTPGEAPPASQRGRMNRNVDETINQAEVAPIQRELNDIASDPRQPAFRRKQAKDALDSMEQDRQSKTDSEWRNDSANETALDFRRRVERTIREHEDQMNKYIEEHPDLNQQQIEAVREASQKRLRDTIEDMQQRREELQQRIESDADANAETIESKQGEVADAHQRRTESIDPEPGDRTSTRDTDPEAVANEGYQSVDDSIYDGATDFNERNRMSIGQKLSPDRQVRKVTEPMRELAQGAIQWAQTSKSRPVRGIGRLFTGMTNEAGRARADLAARRKLYGGRERGKMDMKAIEKLADESGVTTEEANSALFAALDPERANELGISKTDLTPEGQVLHDKLKSVIDSTTQENLQRGFITEEAAANGEYMTRAYEPFEDPNLSKFENGVRNQFFADTKQYLGRKKNLSQEMIDSAITDPVYLVGKKVAKSRATWAMQDYGNYLAEAGHAVDSPRPGYVQLPDTPIYGEAAGKHVPRSFAEDFSGYQYTNSFMSALDDAFTVYDRWGIRQGKKALLTVFNPAVRVGNQLSNRIWFAQLGGINPVQFNAKYYQVGKYIDSNHQLYREAVQNGLTGIDITQAEFFARRMARSFGEGDKGNVKKAIEWFQKSYSAADDKARIASYIIRREQGYGVEEATRLTQRQFQDYNSVGFFYDFAAKTPVFGNAFTRFVGDSVRIAANTALDHPLRATTTLMAWNGMTQLMSRISGESDEDRMTRENRYAAPHVPFTDIPLTLQTPWGEINVARFMPWYVLNNINDEGINEFMPFQDLPFERNDDDEFELNPDAFQDPLLGQLAQLFMDKDFRGRSISDPDNNVAGDKFAEDLSPEEKRNNILRFLFTQNAPLGNEIDAVVSSAMDKEDVYGKERSIPQSLARLFGIKVEEFGEEQAQKQRDTNAYFEDLDRINEELKELSPREQEAWKRLTGYYKLREMVDNDFDPGSKRYKKAPVFDFSEDKWRDYASNPNLYDLMVRRKIADNERDGTPIQPEFDERLSQSFRRQLIANKSVAPGDDAELDQRMYTSPEWDYYQTLKKQYSKDANKHYGNSDFTPDELVKTHDDEYPEKLPVYAQYTAAYGEYADGKREKPEFTDEVKAAREKYQKEMFDWTNEARHKRGLPAITWDVWNNPTFGFNENPSGYGFGGRGRGGGSRRDPANYVNLLTTGLTNYTGQVKRLQPMEAQTPPNEVAIFKKLLAGGGGKRSKPRLGASSKGV